MRRRPIIPPIDTSQQPMALQVLEHALAMLIQISNLNRQLLDYVTLAQRSDGHNKEILSEFTRIKITIDDIEETYKVKINEIKQIVFNHKYDKGILRDKQDLKRFVDRITEKIYRKNMFHQRYHRYLPNNILLNRQILNSLKILHETLENRTITNLLELVQILNFMQYENILLYKHLVAIFITNNVIESEEEIIRQVAKEKEVSEESPSVSDNRTEEEEFNFQSYIDNSLVQMEKQKSPQIFEMPKTSQIRFNRRSKESNISKNTRRSSDTKINQEIQVEIQDIKKFSEPSERLQISGKSKRLKNNGVLTPTSPLREQQQNFKNSQIQEKVLSIKRMSQSLGDISRSSPAYSTRKYIINKSTYPKPLHPANVKIIPTNNPTHVAKIKLSMRNNYPFVISPANNSQKKSPRSIGKKVLKNFSTNIIKNEHYSVQNIKMSGVTKATTIRPLETQYQTLNQSLVKGEQEITNRMSTQKFNKRKAQIQQNYRFNSPTQVLPHSYLQDENCFSTKLPTPDSSMVEHYKNHKSIDQLSNILTCNSYNLHDQRSSIKKHYKNKCNCKLNHSASYSRENIKRYLKRHYEIKNQPQKNEATINFNNAFCASGRQGRIKIPMYYKSGKSLKNKIITKQLNCFHNTIDLISPRNSILITHVSNGFQGSVIDRNSLRAPRRTTLFRKSKEKLFEIFDTLRREFI